MGTPGGRVSYAVSRVYVAVDSVLRNDGTLTTLLAGDRVYADGEQGEGAALPFILLGSSQENAEDSYGRGGNDGTLMITVHASSKKSALAIGEHVNRLLHGVAITISGHVYVDAECDHLRDFPDPSGSHVAALVYSVETQVAV